MRDLKYYSLIIGEAKWRKLLKAIRSKCLGSVLGAFASNLMRTASLAFTPAEIAYRARRDQRFDDYAAFKSTGEVSPQLSFLVEDELPENIQKELGTEREKEQTLPQSELNERKKDFGVAYVESLLQGSVGAHVSIEAVLSSVIVESWSTFESLAGDLWKTAVNHGPPILAQRVNLATHDKPDRNVAAHWKDKLQYDPRQDYAGALVESGRVTFRRLDKIVEWYSITFEDRARQIFRDNRDINALAAYRNSLIHNSGRADKDFIRQIECVSDLRGKFKDNQELPLDGELAKRLRNAAISVGLLLIQLADDFITPVSDADDDS